MLYDNAGSIWGRIGADSEEVTLPYPKGIEVVIDAITFLTTGQCVEERNGTRTAQRRWIAVAPQTENGFRVPARLIDEQGIPGLHKKAERERLREQP